METNAIPLYLPLALATRPLINWTQSVFFKRGLQWKSMQLPLTLAAIERTHSLTYGSILSNLCNTYHQNLVEKALFYKTMDWSFAIYLWLHC